MSERIRTKVQVETDYQQALTQNEVKNRQLISSAEDVLFTTFTKELADRVKITPRYINEKAEEINTALWSIVEWFFEQYNAAHDDCTFEIDDASKTVTATNYEKLPCLFYYWTGSRNKPYQSLKSYGMAKDFKPHHGRITLTSIIGRGIIHELSCADSGALTVDADIASCTIALYTVEISSLVNRTVREYTVLCGKTESGETLTDEQCQAILNLPIKSCTEEGHKSPHWLKTVESFMHLTDLCQGKNFSPGSLKNFPPAQAEEIDKMKLWTKAKKIALTRDLDDLDRQVKAAEADRDSITNDRLKLLALDKKVNLLRQEYMKKQESQFFDAMRLDLELEEQIKEFTEKEKLTTKITREFVLKVEGAL